MKNTRVEFMYRDGSNYKYHGDIVVEGELKWSDLVQFLDDDGKDKDENEGKFCPEDVGIEHPGLAVNGFPGQDDHAWVEIDSGCLTPTNQNPTNGTAAELLELFRLASEAGWPSQTKGITASCQD